MHQDSGEPPLKKPRSSSTEDVHVSTSDPVSMASVVTLTGVSNPSTYDTSDLAGKTRLMPKTAVAVTTGNVRPSLLTSQKDLFKNQNVAGVRLTAPQFLQGTNLIPVQPSWTTDGKYTLTIAPGGFTTPPPKSPISMPPSTTTARFPGPQVITVPSKTTAVTTAGINKQAKPGVTVVDARTQQPVKRVVPDGSSAPVEPVKLAAGQHQISFQVPLNWQTQGSKSLLDSNKTVSLVSLNPSDTNSRSLLQGNDSLVSQSGVTNTCISIPKLTVAGTSNIAPKTFITGSNLYGNLGSNQVIAPATSVSASSAKTTSAASIARMTKGSSFVISNKQYTIVPSNATPVVTQLVKTEKHSKGKVTMAEAQIMLPTGPAKISWPLQAQTTGSTTDNKHILITAPLGKQGKPGTGKPQVLVTAIDTTGKPSIPTAKVVEVSSSNRVILAGNHAGQKFSLPVSSVIPAQKNWELVKQSSQLIPQNPNKCASEKNAKKKDKEKGTAISEKTNTENEQDRRTSESEDEKKHCVAESKAQQKTAMDMEETDTQSDISAESKTETEEGVKMEVEEGDTAGNIDTKPATSEQEHVDPVSASNWKNGVGELSGSNLKFQVNLGMLEVMNDDLECNETLNTSDELDNMTTSSSAEVKTENQDVKAPTPSKKGDASNSEVSNKDEINQCANCGEYGFITDFYKDGRFCSQTCIRAFESKHVREVKKQGTMSKMLLNMKKGKKKILLKDGVPADQKEAKVDPYAWKKSKAFVWTRYLEQEKAAEAPARLFKNPFPAIKNNFRVGMKLEGIDPMHQSKFCVLSVVEVIGYRIRLHFDGYSECFDFWQDIDSAFIFPVGFCEKMGKTLQPPKGFTVEEFSWPTYLKLTKAVPAPKNLFSNQPVQSVTPNLFRVGSKLEAVDKKNSSLICVASVADTLGDKVLIHFDSWEDNYDYWCDMTSPFIHPVGYCEENELVLSPPADWKDVSAFTWEKYLTKTKSQAVPARAFKPHQPIAFESGMKVEVVDKRNPLLVRVASIIEVENYMVKIHFDGWSDIYDYWLEDDSPDIHPPGWCAKTGHPLVPPITPSDLVVNTGPGVCPTPGCKGIGHIKGPKYSGHHSTFGCPYSDINMNKESVLGDRLNAAAIRQEEARSRFINNQQSPDGKRDLGGNSELPKKLGRGRKPKSYYAALEEEKASREREQLEKEETLREGIHNSVFSSSMISAPKPDVPLCWEQHCKLLPGVTSIRGNEVSKWTTDQVAAFINTLPGCEDQAKLFKEEQIDGEAFLLLTQADIVKIMNIKLGPALKIFNSIVMFKNSIEV